MEAAYAGRGRLKVSHTVRKAIGPTNGKKACVEENLRIWIDSKVCTLSDGFHTELGRDIGWLRAVILDTSLQPTDPVHWLATAINEGIASKVPSP